MQPNAIVYAWALRDSGAFFSSTSTSNMPPRMFFLVFFATREKRAAVCRCYTHTHIQRMALRLRLTCVGCAVSGIVVAYK